MVHDPQAHGEARVTQQDTMHTHFGVQRELAQTDADADPQEPVSELARRIIGQRLSRVARLLPRAANQPEKDIEYVHDLRVGARRATAALQMFAPCLPPPTYKEMTSVLRRVRRAAGPARDLDVIGERLSRLAVAGGTTPRLAIAIDRIRRRRQRAQAPLVKAYKRALKRSFKSKARDLPALVQWNGDGPEPDLRGWAGSALHPVLDRFVARSSVDLTDTKALHRMRIAEKGVRYSLEVLGEPLGQPVDRVAPILHELQQRLGEINDHDTARTLLLRWRDRSKGAGLREMFAYLAAFEKWGGSYAHDQFLEWWTPGRRSDLHEGLNAVLRATGHPEPLAALGETGTPSNLTFLR